MADTTEGDSNVLQLDILALLLVSFIAGLVIHSFIIGFNVNDLWKGRSVTPVDHIVTSLEIARMCAQCFVTIYVFMVIYFPRNLDLYLPLVIIGKTYDFFTFANIWLTALLSIVFCLKISNFHTRLFLCLKGLILQRTIHCIVVSLLLSAVSCLMPLIRDVTEVTTGHSYNKSMNILLMGCNHMNTLYNYIIGAVFPLLFYSISSILLFTFLYHHTTMIKMSSSLSINLETYYSVMRFVSFTFIYNTIYFIGHFIGLFYYYFSCVNLVWVYTVLDFLPLLHSSYLIYRTTKFRDQMSKVLPSVVNFLFQRKDTETRENMEMAAV